MGWKELGKGILDISGKAAGAVSRPIISGALGAYDSTLGVVHRQNQNLAVEAQLLDAYKRGQRFNIHAAEDRVKFQQLLGAYGLTEEQFKQGILPKYRK